MMAVEAFTNPKKIEFWKQALLDYAEETLQNGVTMLKSKLLDLEEIPDYVNLMIYGRSGLERQYSQVQTIGNLLLRLRLTAQ